MRVALRFRFRLKALLKERKKKGREGGERRNWPAGPTRRFGWGIQLYSVLGLEKKKKRRKRKKKKGRGNSVEIRQLITP